MLYRNLFFVVFSIFLLSLCIQAQTVQNDRYAFTKGSWELNLSGDIGSQTSTSKYESGGYSQEYSSDHTYFQLHIIPGYFIIDGLSFEPELDFLFLENSKPSYSLIPNLSYTYLLPSNSKLALYVRGGYGLSNSYNLFGLLIRTSNSLDVGVINLGAGIKFLATENFSIRTEINYRRTSYTDEYSYSDPYYSYSSKTKNTLSNVRLLLGLSIIL